MSVQEVLEKDPESGRFLPGNSGFGGRPKGSRNKLAEEFFNDFHAVWQTDGIDAIKRMAKDKPSEFVRTAAFLMPKDFSPLTEDMASWTPDQLKEFLIELKSTIDAIASTGEAGNGSLIEARAEGEV